MADETICRNCRRGIQKGLRACPHCGDPAPYAARVVQPMAVDDRPAVYATPPRAPVEQSTNPIVGYGCLGLVALAVVMFFARPSRSSSSRSDQLDLTAPTTFTLKPGYVACTTQAALEASKPMTDVGDQAALRRFLADPTNGCVLTRANGARVYTERASYGVQRVRPEGSPTSLYVLKAALAQ